MKRWLTRLAWLALGFALATVALGPVSRREVGRAPRIEVAVDGTQVVIDIPTFYVGFQKSPAAILQSLALSLLSPFYGTPTDHRVDQHLVLVLDGRTVRRMIFPGVGGAMQMTAEGPMTRVGNQYFRWNDRSLVQLTDEEAANIQRNYAGESTPPWSKHGMVFRDPPNILPLTIGGASYRLEARASGDVKTLTLIDAQGTRRELFSIDEAFRTVSAEQYRERFR